MKKRSFLGLTRHLLFLALVFMTACGSSSNGALPQATIPLPKQDDSSDDAIVVSAPDASGMVAVKGSSSLVSDETVLLAQVVGEVEEGDDSSIQAEDDQEALNDAKENCAEVLPVCPELNSDNLCQHDANDDGSFYFTVPAEISDYVKLAYQVTNTCESGDVAEVQVKDEDVKIKVEEVDLPEIEKTAEEASVDALTTDDNGSESETSEGEGSTFNENSDTTTAFEEENIENQPKPVESLDDIIKRKIDNFEFKKVPFVRFIDEKLVMLVGIHVPGENEVLYYIIKGDFDFVTGFKLDNFWHVTDTNNFVIARYRVRFEEEGSVKHILTVRVPDEYRKVIIFLNSMHMIDRDY